MTTKTIAYVKEPNPWTDRATGNVKGFFLNGNFDDGQHFSALVMGDKAKADEAYKQLHEYVGKAGDFEYEERTNPNNGQKELKLKAWPGKPLQQGGGGYGGRGGGGKQWTESYAQSREAHAVTQASIQHHGALQFAVQFGLGIGVKEPEGVLAIARHFLPFLTVAQPPQQPQQPTPPADPSANGHHEKSKQFEDFTSVWLKSQCSGDPKDKAKVWERTKQVAAKHGYDEAKLRACSDPKIFDAIKRDMQAIAKGEEVFPF